ncbi:hypothetical protein M434DRAFT_39075 [Hypoxylon sp. CO27-5]|nr:hypothetical protein M434DRAFT_39075 [Hypoxylon sp. CO27-5]
MVQQPIPSPGVNHAGFNANPNVMNAHPAQVYFANHFQAAVVTDDEAEAEERYADMIIAVRSPLPLRSYCTSHHPPLPSPNQNTTLYCALHRPPNGQVTDNALKGEDNAAAY